MKAFDIKLVHSCDGLSKRLQYKQRIRTNTGKFYNFERRPAALPDKGLAKLGSEDSGTICDWSSRLPSEFCNKSCSMSSTTYNTKQNLFHRKLHLPESCSNLVNMQVSKTLGNIHMNRDRIPESDLREMRSTIN